MIKKSPAELVASLLAITAHGISGHVNLCLYEFRDVCGNLGFPIERGEHFETAETFPHTLRKSARTHA